MRKFFIGFIVAVVATSSSVSAAETNLVLSDTQIATIQANCDYVMAALHKVHSHDALVRVTLYQRYETIATRVMAPFTSRVALNGIDGIDLTSTSVEFKQRLKAFADAYLQYESTTSSTLKMRCRDNPVDFYASIVRARDERAAVYETTKELNRLLEQYRSDFEKIAKEHGGTS
jgi:hypothetical protein